MFSFIGHRVTAHFKPAILTHFKPVFKMTHFNPVQLAVASLLLCLCACLNEPAESSPAYLPMDDSEYPYADLPRIVIETEDFAGIRDRETEFPSHLQVYGKDAPESGVYELTVRGRGNSSFKMPKYGMKLEFKDKVSLFGMPKNRDWALIANFGDKSHLRNYMAMRLSEWLGMPYTPRCTFVEVYLNRKYMGLYLLSETVKVAKRRVNIEENDTTFLFEKESDKKIDPPFIRSSLGYAFHVKSPKNPSEKSLELLRNHLDDFERRMRWFSLADTGAIAEWIDMESFVPYYWVQEFSKNEDAYFARSIFMTWQKGGKIGFGPVWDFDISFGNESYEINRGYEDWHIRKYRWFSYFFKDESIRYQVSRYWFDHRETFRALIDSVPLYEGIIAKAVENEYRRWPIMSNTENWALKEPYEDYDEAIDVMVEWMKNRFDWIEMALNGENVSN